MGLGQFQPEALHGHEYVTELNVVPVLKAQTATKGTCALEGCT